jgi:hypothetical protein
MLGGVRRAAAEWSRPERSQRAGPAGMEWAVALPGGPPPPTPRRGRGPRGPIVIRRNAQPGGLGPADRRSCRAGGTGRGRGRGAGGILSRRKLRPARPAQGGPRRGRGPCGAGRLGLLPRKERARGHGSGGPSQGRCKGAAPGPGVQVGGPVQRSRLDCAARGGAGVAGAGQASKVNEQGPRTGRRGEPGTGSRTGLGSWSEQRIRGTAPSDS